MTDTNHIEVLRSALVRIAMGESDAQKIADDALATARTLSTRASAGEGVQRRKASDYADATYGPDDLAAIWNACCEAHKAAAPQPEVDDSDYSLWPGP